MVLFYLVKNSDRSITNVYTERADKYLNDLAVKFKDSVPALLERMWEKHQE